MIAIIDYDAGNLKSVEKALIYLKQDVLVTREHSKILNADKVILPGVGSFGDAMEKIRHYELEETIKTVIADKKPFLGICLGLQLLYEQSEESKGVKGLSILQGKIHKFKKENFKEEENLKIPHMGWNSLTVKNGTALFRGLDEESYVYFVHSYYLQAKNEAEISAVSDYGIRFHAAVEKENVFAVQFHPEKSGNTGLAILKNFASL